MDILLKLRQNSLCLLQGELVFLCINGAHEFVFLEFQLRVSHIVAVLKQCHLVLCCQNCSIGLGLGDFLLGLK